MNEQKRRVKIVSIDARLVLDAFFPAREFQMFHYIKLPLPEGYRVESVQTSWERKCLDVLVSHPSFPEVEWHEMPERIPALDAELVAYARVEGAGSDLPVYREQTSGPR